MKKVDFRIDIDATKEKVWQTLWDDKTYRQWTSVFSPTSHVETDWKVGSKVLFLDADRSGMVSRIEANEPNKFMSFQHLGEVKNGVEDIKSEKVKAWAGAYENYTLTEADGATKLLVELEIDEAFAPMFTEMFPKALQQVKEISERA